jgi:hypothetical protein
MSDKHHCGFCGNSFNHEWLLGSHILHVHGTNWPMSPSDMDAVQAAKDKVNHHNLE